MKQKTNTRLLFIFFMTMVLQACNNEKKTEETKVSSSESAASAPAYNPDMDPVKVEAKFIKLLSDTLGVKLFEGVYQPGDSVDFHAHPDHILYILEGTTLEITLDNGTTQTVELPTGFGAVNGPVTHKAKIIGPSPLRLIAADIYRPRN